MQQLDSLKDRYLDSLGETNRNIIIKKVTFNDSMYVVVDGLVLIDVEEVDELIRHEKSITLKYDGSEIGALLIS